MKTITFKTFAKNIKPAQITNKRYFKVYLSDWENGKMNDYEFWSWARFTLNRETSKEFTKLFNA